MSLAKGARPFILVPLVSAALLISAAALTGWWYALASVPFLFFGFFGLWFFRDPERDISDGITCPADGRVLFIEERDDPEVGPCTRVAIFMSPLDVHVNRAPVTGKVARLTHHSGGYLPAFDKESERNERVETVWVADGNDPEGATEGTRIKMVQIAGAVARRIVPWVVEEDRLKRGERMGMIRYGSRVDVYLPQGLTPAVKDGERVWAGRTRLAGRKA